VRLRCWLRMSNNNLTETGIQIALLTSLEEQLTSHSSGLKRVFINNNTETPLTQFAYGSLKKGDQTGVHVHKTMDEYFFIVSGEGVLECGAENFTLIPKTFLKIPAGTNHNLSNNNDRVLEFVYFGIAT
jgi:mannose-6-phosphate isomerase-like protein (cupin superfamily)